MLRNSGAHLTTPWNHIQFLISFLLYTHFLVIILILLAIHDNVISKKFYTEADFQNSV